MYINRSPIKTPIIVAIRTSVLQFFHYHSIYAAICLCLCSSGYLFPVYVLIKQSVLHVHSLFQSKFSTERDLVLHLSISNFLLFPYEHPVAAYVFFLVYLSLLSSVFTLATCFWRNFLHKVSSIQFVFVLFIVCRNLLSSLTPSSTSSFSHDRSNWSPSLSSSTPQTLSMNLCLK